MSQKHPKIQLFLNLIKTCKSCSRLGGGLVFEVWLGPKRHFFEVFSEALWMLPSNTKIIEKWHWNGTPKGDFILGLLLIGAPLAPQSVFGHKKYTQSAPKMTSRVQKWPQNASKVTPKVAKWTLTGAPKWFKCIKRCQLQDTRPGGLREALSIKLRFCSPNVLKSTP